MADAEPKDLVISNWQNGIADSPMLGFADMRNLDVTTRAGIARINYRSSQVAGPAVPPISGTINNVPQWFAKDPLTGFVYMLDFGGGFWASQDNGITWTSIGGHSAGGNGQGLAVWKNYVFVATGTNVDVLQISTTFTSPSWHNAWFTTSLLGFGHPMLAMLDDDTLYIGNGRYVASVQENPTFTFAPGTSATYTQTNQACTLPANYQVTCLCEFANYLMVGTTLGSTVGNMPVADIFYWDTTSPTFNGSIKIQEYGVYQLLPVNGMLYISAGLRARVFIANATFQIQELRWLRSIQFPDGGYVLPYPGAIAYHDGKVLIAFSEGSFGQAGANPLGVYAIFGQGSYTFHHQIADGITSGSMAVACILSVSPDAYLIGWWDGTNYGIDRVTGSAAGATTFYRFPSYVAYADSQFFRVGTPNSRRQFSDVEIILDQPLATGHGVKVQYRTSLAAAWTTILTFDFQTYGAVSSYNSQFMGGDVQFPDACESIQFRVSLTTGVLSNTTPELVEVRLR